MSFDPGEAMQRIVHNRFGKTMSDWNDIGNGKRIKIETTTVTCFNTGTIQLQPQESQCSVHKELFDIKESVQNMGRYGRATIVHQGQRIDALENKVNGLNQVVDGLKVENNNISTQLLNINVFMIRTDFERKCIPIMKEVWSMISDILKAKCWEMNDGNKIYITGKPIDEKYEVHTLYLVRSIIGKKLGSNVEFERDSISACLKNYLRNTLPGLLNCNSIYEVETFLTYIKKYKDKRNIEFHDYHRKAVTGVVNGDPYFNNMVNAVKELPDYNIDERNLIELFEKVVICLKNMNLNNDDTDDLDS
jgi:hypothetical protein